MPAGTRKTAAKGRTIRRKKKTAPEEAESQLLSPAAFGKLIGATRQAVDKAIRDGRLSKSVSRETRGTLVYTRIDVGVGRREWASNTAPRLETGVSTVSLDAEILGPGPPDTGDTETGDSEGSEEEGIDYARERARKEKFLADKHAIDVARRSSQLVDLQVVIRACVALGRAVKDGLADSAIELPDELVHMKTAKEIQIALEKHVAAVCLELDAQVESLIGELEEDDA